MVYVENKDKLGDFGEEIGGAKKDLYRFKTLNLSDKETQKLPLSKLWNKKEIDEIEDKQIAAIAYALREDIPNKPRNDYKLRLWIADLAKRQEIINALLENRVTAENVINDLLDRRSLTGSKIYLLSQIERKDWGLIGSTQIGYTYLDNGEKGLQFSVGINGTMHRFPYDMGEDWTKSVNINERKAVINSSLENIKKLIEDANRELLSSTDTKDAKKTSKPIKFDVYYYRSTGEAFIVASVDRQKTPLVSGFKTIADAKVYRDENLEELNQLWIEHKEQNTITKSDMRNSINEDRTGRSYRDGDITPEQFMETFGIRGGQFGNWVNTEERQKMLNATYDGFMDLSKALNIEPKAIGLDGNLAIAFGARGSGWASAHYEHHEKVINLTKTRGAGSLAHEWWHSLDHYMNNHSLGLLTENANSSQILHEELKEPVHKLLTNIMESDLYKRSLNADGYRNGAYFSKKEEMTARAFEAVIFQMLKEQGIKNDFLVNIKSETSWSKNDRAYPYPRSDELETLKQSYKQVFDTLKDVNKEFIPIEYEVENIVHSDTLDKLELNISIKDFEHDPELKEVQDRVVKDALDNGQALINTYKRMENTYDGRYIASDMMKEVFNDFSQSPAHRNKFNNAVHNTAATLSAEHFKQMLNMPIENGRDTIVFLTGSPGAGKTSTVMNNGKLKENVAVVFEGQLANAHQNPATIDKIQQAIDNGFKVEIVAINPLPEQALENTFKRFYDPNDGRGASISTMAHIQGNTYDGLKYIQEKFGDKINLTIVDKPFGNQNSQKYIGWENLNVLKSQGSKAEITQRLENHLLHHYLQGNIDYECFKQSAGSEDRAKQLLDSRLDRQFDQSQRTNDGGRELPPRSSETSNQQRTEHSSYPNGRDRENESQNRLNTERVYLYTSPKDAEAMRELQEKGVIRFDIKHKVWYANEENRDAVAKWASRPYVPSPEEALANHLKSQGVIVEAGHPKFDGKSHRLSNDGSKEKNVMYHAHPNYNGIPFATITNFSRGNTPEKWLYPIEYLNTLRNIEAVERAKGNNYQHEFRSQPNQHSQQQQKEELDATIIAQANLMAERTKMLVSICDIAPPDHNYLSKKQITANNTVLIVPDSSKLPDTFKQHIMIANTPTQVREMKDNNPENKMIVQRGNLVIPQYNKLGELRAFEMISYNGGKYALGNGAEKKGISTTLGNLEDGKPVILAEGYATGATLHEQTGRNVVIAFGRNGLLDVAQQLREKYPNSRIYIGADNDHTKPLENKINQGLEDANKVAQTVSNTYVLVPQFDEKDTGKDWNDILVDKGADEFKRQIKEQLMRIQPTIEQENTPKPTPQEQKTQEKEKSIDERLSTAEILKNYPTMSEENLKSIEKWMEVLPNKYPNEPTKLLFSLQRLEDKLPALAQGEILPPPKAEQNIEHKPPETSKNNAIER